MNGCLTPSELPHLGKEPPGVFLGVGQPGTSFRELARTTIKVIDWNLFQQKGIPTLRRSGSGLLLKTLESWCDVAGMLTHGAVGPRWILQWPV